MTPYVDIVRVEAFVLARKAGYDDWVRRAAAIDPMAIPPSKPTSRTMARYPPPGPPKVAPNRYQATVSMTDSRHSAASPAQCRAQSVRGQRVQRHRLHLSFQ